MGVEATFLVRRGASHFCTPPHPQPLSHKGRGEPWGVRAPLDFYGRGVPWGVRGKIFATRGCSLLNWYTAMCFNRMLKRTGHFWEKRYYCEGFAPSDRERALNTLRYIHGNPKAAKMRKGFFYDFSNYGSYERLTDDGLTQWHPAFLQLGSTLDECAQKYRTQVATSKYKHPDPPLPPLKKGGARAFPPL
jgi:hypothetical protein